jgi:hypothetical protein
MLKFCTLVFLDNTQLHTLTEWGLYIYTALKSCNFLIMSLDLYEKCLGGLEV